MEWKGTTSDGKLGGGLGARLHEVKYEKGWIEVASELKDLQGRRPDDTEQ